MQNISSNIDKLVDWLITLNLNFLISSLIGLFGVILGILITEYFKVKERESMFSESIFIKRLNIHEKLFSIMNDCSEKANNIFQDSTLTAEQRHDIWSDVVLDLAKYTDDNKLYISEYLTIHCMLTLIGVEDINDLPVKEKELKISEFYNDMKKVVDLIKEETGLKRLDSFLKKLNRSKLDSNYIEEYKKIKTKYESK